VNVWKWGAGGAHWVGRKEEKGKRGGKRAQTFLIEGGKKRGKRKGGGGEFGRL